MTGWTELLEPFAQMLLAMPAGAAGAVDAVDAVDAEETWAIVRLLGRLHPAAVHFPIALIATAGGIELFGLMRRKRSPHAVAVPCLVIGALAAGLAAWFGWINADNEPHGRALTNLIFWHRWTGVSLAALAGIGALFALAECGIRKRGKESWLAAGYRAALIGAVVLTGVGGYLGGEIVYGEGYLLEVFRDRPAPMELNDETDAPAALVAGGVKTDPGTTEPGELSTVDFTASIEPILRERCYECHGPEKGKGGLRLHDKKKAFPDDPEWWVIKPGDAAGSLLYELITLHPDDPERMPARGDALDAKQIALIRDWIDQGAAWSDASAPAASIAPTDPAPSVPAPAAVGNPTPAPAPIAPAPIAADPAITARALDALRARGAVAMVVAEDSKGIDVNLALADGAVDDDDLRLLAGLESSLVRLDLARTKVTDGGLAQLARFSTLRRLHLENTAIGDKGVAHLAGLKKLEYLNLYGTAVTDAGLEHLERLPELKKLYVWKTQVTDAGIERLRSRLPALDIVGAIEFAVAVPIEEEVKPEGVEGGTGGAEGETDEDTETGDPAKTTETAALPDCCATAQAAGGECTHPCCVAAAKDGKICAKCAGLE